MGVGLEIVLNGFGLDDPLIGSISALVHQLRRLVIVHRLDLGLAVLDVWALNLEILDEHFLSLSFSLTFLSNKI